MRECGGGPGPHCPCDGGCDGECGECDLSNWWTFGPHRLWFQGDYLTWWGKSANLPPLVTTSPAGTPLAQAGVIGQSGTSTLFGGDSVDLGDRSGGRFTLGYWFSPCCDEGLEVTYMFLGSKGVGFDQTSAVNPILTRPFYNVQTAMQNSFIFAYPNQQTGSLAAGTTNEFNSVEILYRQALLKQCGREMDILVGYRYARFAEDLAIDGTSTYISAVGDIPVNTTIQLSDRFAASNEFHGAELGFVAKTECNRWSLELLGKLAMGSTRSQVSINGSTVVTEPDQAPATYPGGLLALPSNSGTFQRNSFAVIPEFGATLGYDLTCRLKLTVGYTFLYWSQLVRPGDQVDTNVNPSQTQGGTLSGIASPQFKFVSNDFSAQGVNVGFDYRF